MDLDHARERLMKAAMNSPTEDTIVDVLLDVLRVVGTLDDDAARLRQRVEELERSSLPSAGAVPAARILDNCYREAQESASAGAVEPPPCPFCGVTMQTVCLGPCGPFGTPESWANRSAGAPTPPDLKALLVRWRATDGVPPSLNVDFCVGYGAAKTDCADELEAALKIEIGEPGVLPVPPREELEPNALKALRDDLLRLRTVSRYCPAGTHESHNCQSLLAVAYTDVQAIVRRLDAIPVHPPPQDDK